MTYIRPSHFPRCPTDPPGVVVPCGEDLAPGEEGDAKN